MTHHDNGPEKKVKDRSFQAEDPVTNLVEAVDYIFKELELPSSVFRNPSYKSDSSEMFSGMTNTYLMPIRMGRKAIIGNTEFYYGRKIHPFPKPYELISFEAPADIYLFFENRIKETLTDYLSIHSGKNQLNLDIREAVIIDIQKIGFDNNYQSFSKNSVLTIGDLRKIITRLLGS